MMPSDVGSESEQFEHSTRGSSEDDERYSRNYLLPNVPVDSSEEGEPQLFNPMVNRRVPRPSVDMNSFSSSSLRQPLHFYTTEDGGVVLYRKKKLPSNRNKKQNKTRKRKKKPKLKTSYPFPIEDLSQYITQTQPNLTSSSVPSSQDYSVEKIIVIEETPSDMTVTHQNNTTNVKPPDDGELHHQTFTNIQEFYNKKKNQNDQVNDAAGSKSSPSQLSKEQVAQSLDKLLQSIPLETMMKLHNQLNRTLLDNSTENKPSSSTTTSVPQFSFNDSQFKPFVPNDNSPKSRVQFPKTEPLNTRLHAGGSATYKNFTDFFIHNNNFVHENNWTTQGNEQSNGPVSSSVHYSSSVLVEPTSKTVVTTTSPPMNSYYFTSQRPTTMSPKKFDMDLKMKTSLMNDKRTGNDEMMETVKYGRFNSPQDYHNGINMHRDASSMNLVRDNASVTITQVAIIILGFCVSMMILAGIILIVMHKESVSGHFRTLGGMIQERYPSRFRRDRPGPPTNPTTNVVDITSTNVPSYVPATTDVNLPDTNFVDNANDEAEEYNTVAQMQSQRIQASQQQTGHVKMNRDLIEQIIGRTKATVNTDFATKSRSPRTYFSKVYK